MAASMSERSWVFLAVLTAVVGNAYFLMLDQIVFSSARFAPIFRFLLLAYDAKTALFLVAACGAAALWRKPEPILKMVDFLSSRPAQVALIAAVLFAVGSVQIYHSHPLSMDEYAAVFQAKTFATGHVAARFPASAVDWLVMPGFNGAFLYASHETGRVIEGYWPGFALLLSPFVLIHAPWACNAVLAGLALYFIYKITFAITGELRAAGWAILFTIASGGFIANAISYYSMQAHLTANLLFAYLLIEPNPKKAFLAGLAGSLALILHNPLPHVLFAVPWLASMAIRKDDRRELPYILLGYVPGLLIGIAWLWLRFSIAPVTQDATAIGAVSAGIFVWPDALLLNIRAASLAKLWIWSSPVLLAFALAGCIRFRTNRLAMLLTQSALLTFVGYLFVRFDQGHGWGYRYFHSAWGCLPIFAGCAMTGRSDSHPRVVAFAGAASVLGLLVIVPLQMTQIDSFISRHLAQLPTPAKAGNEVFFIRPGTGFYIADMIQADPRLRQHDLLLSSRGGDLDAQLMRQNWPDAVKVANTPMFEEWHLDPTPDEHRWTLSYRPTNTGF